MSRIKELTEATAELTGLIDSMEASELIADIDFSTALSTLREMRLRLADEANSLDQNGAEVKAKTRLTKCPQCGSGVIQQRSGEDYCEECGWPDENRATTNQPLNASNAPFPE